jgi:tyrosyl-tRNA synthetase
MTDREEAVERLLTHRVVQVVERDELRRLLLTADRPLRAKIGFDPTSPDLHIGHAVLLERVRAWQELGNTAVLVVGDTTAQIGDPSERNVTRPMLTEEQVRANAQTYLEQFYKVVDPDHTEIRWQSEWFGAFGLRDVFSLMSRLTVARMIERDTFAKRLAEGVPISMHETLYPFLQAYDSVAVEADLEMGGTDQTFNLLVGTDGVAKMSKSLGNAIGLTDAPYAQYAKAMSIPDELMDNWAHLVTRWSDEEADAFVASIASAELHGKAAKQRLAREIVARWHSERDALAAEDEWERSVGRGEPTGELREVALPAGGLLDLLVGAELASSRGEARRLVRQRGVRLDGDIGRAHV